MSNIKVPVGFRSHLVQSTPSKLALAFCYAILAAIAAGVKFYTPFMAVEITLQTLMVFAVGMLLGPRYGVIAMIMYILPWMTGLPFIGYMPSLFFHPVDGYLFGSMLCAFVVGRLYYAPRFQKLSLFIQYAVLFFSAILSLHLPGLILKGTGAVHVCGFDVRPPPFTPFALAEILKFTIAFVFAKFLDRRMAK